jgi:hypothetical protein
VRFGASKMQIENPRITPMDTNQSDLHSLQSEIRRINSLTYSDVPSLPKN